MYVCRCVIHSFSSVYSCIGIDYQANSGEVLQSYLSSQPGLLSSSRVLKPNIVGNERHVLDQKHFGHFPVAGERGDHLKWDGVHLNY